MDTDSPLLPGVLRLACARSHGRAADGRQLFALQPRAPGEPALLAPCAPPRAAFAKRRADRYVLFRSDGGGRARVAETLGEVHAPGAFRAYELAARGLRAANAPLAAQVRAALALGAAPAREAAMLAALPPGADLRADPRFRAVSLDAPGAALFDDAFGAESLPGGGAAVRLYVADARAWCAALGLWEALAAAARTRTLYLPGAGGRLPMLPPALEALASLAEGETRFALLLELRLDAAGAECGEQPPARAVALRVARNFAFDDPAAADDPDCARLLALARRRDPAVEDARDMVAHWMRALNARAAQLLLAGGAGIFRTAALTPSRAPSDADAGLAPAERDAARTWREGAAGDYAPHPDPAKTAYAHASSPIRRLGDLVNQTLLLPSSSAADAFAAHWVAKAPFLGDQARAAAAAERACLLEETAARLDAKDTVSARLDGFWLAPRDPDGRRWAHIPALGAAFRTHRAGDPAAPEESPAPRTAFRLLWFPDESGGGRRARVVLQGTYGSPVRPLPSAE